MNAYKRFLICLAALVLTANAFTFSGFAADGDAESAAFKPVLRFIASSDTHVRDDNDLTAGRIGKMLDLGYAAAQQDAFYNKLDALVIAGDLTHDGTKTEFEKFRDAVFGSLRDETRFLGVVAKNHDGYKMRRAEMRSTYETLTGNDADFHVVIGGCHFIGLSASSNDLMHYDPGQLFWLRKQLDDAIANDPNKPIFVFHHEHVLGTVYGSTLYDTWGVPYFTSILKDYPQVVDFSGHSHYALNDPRSVWQGDFTAIGTGAIYYTEFTVDMTRSYNPEDAYSVATCWIVEVDGANRIRLRGMDVEAGEMLCEYILDNPADPANRPYTPEKRKAASKAPVFAPDASLSVREDDGRLTLEIPPAQPTDGMPVVLYRVYVQNKLGMTVGKDWTMPKYYCVNDQQTVEHTLRGVPAGKYTVRVVAETAYGVQSDALETQVEVGAYLCPRCGKTHQGFTGFFAAVFHRVVWFFSHIAGKR